MGDLIRKGDAEAILEEAHTFGAVEISDVAPGVPVASVPRGRDVLSMKRFVDEYAGKPDRRSGTAEVCSVPSFCELVNRFKDTDSAVFVDVRNEKAPKLIGVLDYNKASPNNDDARFGQHRVTYAFPLSDPWKAWTTPREPMNQAAFAEFLEDRILDVMDPAAAGMSAMELARSLGISLASPSQLLDLSRGLKVRVERKAGAAVTLASGETSISFEETHKGEDGGALKVPGAFVVAVPVFRGGSEVFQLAIRLRYRLQGSAVTWSFAPVGADRVFDAAIGGAVAFIRETTALPVFYGAPETTSK